MLSFKIAKSKSDLNKLYKIRKKIFVDEEGYPVQSIKSIHDKYATHFIAQKGKAIVGTISIIFDNPFGLHMEQYTKIPKRIRNNKIAEIYKLAILPEERKGIAGTGLMLFAYEYAKKHRIEIICIGSLEKNLSLFKSIGFKTFGKFKLFNNRTIVLLMLDIKKHSIFEIDRKKSIFRKFLISHKLSKWFKNLIRKSNSKKE